MVMTYDPLTTYETVLMGAGLVFSIIFGFVMYLRNRMLRVEDE